MSDNIPLALPADGSETHLATKKIAGANFTNLDRDDEILAATDKSEGKWRFYGPEGNLIAESPAPGEINAGIISQWAQAVRARCKRELTQEDVDRKLNKEKAGGIVGADGAAISTDDTDIQRAVEGTPTEPVRKESSLEDDPDGFVKGKIEAAQRKVKSIRVKLADLEEQITELHVEEEAAHQDYVKWTRMLEVINED